MSWAGKSNSELALPGCAARASPLLVCPPHPPQVWGHINGLLEPLVRIGDRTAPALKLAICEPLGALITAHNGAWVHGSWQTPVQPGLRGAAAAATARHSIGAPL